MSYSGYSDWERGITRTAEERDKEQWDKWNNARRQDPKLQAQLEAFRKGPIPLSELAGLVQMSEKEKRFLIETEKLQKSEEPAKPRTEFKKEIWP